jgi:hypothetical protein
MTYSVKTTDQNTTITVATGEVNTKYSVALVGRNVSGYGQFFVENSIWMLENFASSTSPTASGKTALEGQLWYNTSESTMRVYKNDGGTFVWARMTPLIGSEPTTDLTAGIQYFNTDQNKLKFYDGSNWKDSSYPGTITNRYSGELGGSTSIGTRTRTIFLRDTSNLVHPVLAFILYNSGTNHIGASISTENEIIMALYSEDSFDLDTNYLQTTELDN